MRRLAAGAAVVALMGLAACASPASPARMTLGATPGLTAAPGDVGYRSVTTVSVSGGQGTNPLWLSQVSNADFKTALENSLAAAGYMGGQGQPMTVSASLIDLKQPLAGFDMSVISQVRYTVTRAERVLFDETVAATGTASMGESLLGTERIRLANEASIRENIKTFLTRFRARAR
ncbi:hypothetical protein [Brevundimonas sp. SORGH_AS_0993]|uniref:hypothetical protein n=1 Tax=Brevundimonas sp. SORGH_AS_0993 TaxID=3041794 RepID=UPI00278AD9B6|nr:hypothetical protein [Brevundimonas sp. SORGH_AS_0993]MDQ1155085.1 hypothetical protein [Brevundimonas sp. SORGH_AS_0993]